MKYGIACLLVLGVVAFSMATPPRDDSQEEILGRWDHSKSDTCYIRFFQDGTFRMITLNEKMEGVFRFLPGGVVELNFVALGKGVKTSEVKYRIEGDMLEMKFGKSWTRYKRSE